MYDDNDFYVGVLKHFPQAISLESRSFFATAEPVFLKCFVVIEEWLTMDGDRPSVTA